VPRRGTGRRLFGHIGAGCVQDRVAVVKSLLLVAALLVACSADTDGPARAIDRAAAPRGAAETAANAACDARMDRLSATMHTLAADSPVFFFASTSLVPPRSKSGHAVERFGLNVDVEADGRVYFHDEPARDLAELTERLDSTLQMMNPELGVPPLYVRADARTSMAMLGRVVAAIPARITVRRLLVETPAAPLEPPASLLADTRVRALGDGRHTRTAAAMLAYASLVQQSLSGPHCLPIVRYFGDTRGGTDQFERGARTIPAALRECHCQVPDLDLAEPALLALYGAYERKIRWLPLPSPAVLAKTRGTVAELVAAAR